LGRQRRLKEQVAGGYLAQRGRSIALVSRIFCFGRRRIDSGPSWTLTLRVAGASQIYLPDKFVKDGELNKKLSSKAVDYMIKKYCRLIGVEGKITVHSARATVVGSLLEKGISIDKVASFVGHSDLGTTKAYNKRRTKIGESPAFDLDY